jgi:hypothetical protein
MSKDNEVSKSIKLAINAGQKEYNEKRKIVDAKSAAEQAELTKRIVAERAAAMNWVKKHLPEEIRKATSEGKCSLPVSQYVAQACQGIQGITVREEFIKGSSKYEDMYDTEDGWDYTIYW